MFDPELADIFNHLEIPVMVCRDDNELNAFFMNPAAKLIFAPNHAVEKLLGNRYPEALKELVRPEDGEKYQSFLATLRSCGAVRNYPAIIHSFQGDRMPARITANSAVRNEVPCYVFYFDVTSGTDSDEPVSAFMSRILTTSQHCVDCEQAIKSIIEQVGEYSGVSRVYIYEDIPDNPNLTRLSYVWSAPGVEPVDNAACCVRKDAFNYRTIIDSHGMVITNDTRQLPKGDRDFMVGRGVKSTAILPLYHFQTPLGFLGFDDCARVRDWSLDEIRLLRDITSIVSTLLNRRNAEKRSQLARQILQTVTDNLEDMVFISDPESGALRYVSNSICNTFRKTADELLGKPCWRLLNPDQTEKCSFCPLPQLFSGDPDAPTRLSWEFQIPETGKWYLVKDSIIDWIQGGKAHLATLSDITYRKQYEEQLKRFASTDAMTDVYNRKWGSEKLRKRFQTEAAARARQTLCFADLDGLKRINDLLGHSAGDEMILNVIRVVSSCIRKDDFIVRWGGDEFVIFLNCHLSDAENVMEKIHFGLEHFNTTAGKEYRLSISTGLVDFSESFASLDELIEEADRRMYDNKVAKNPYRRQTIRV